MIAESEKMLNGRYGETLSFSICLFSKDGGVAIATRWWLCGFMKKFWILVILIYNSFWCYTSITPRANLCRVSCLKNKNVATCPLIFTLDPTRTEVSLYGLTVIVRFACSRSCSWSSPVVTLMVRPVDRALLLLSCASSAVLLCPLVH